VSKTITTMMASNRSAAMTATTAAVFMAVPLSARPSRVGELLAPVCICLPSPRPPAETHDRKMIELLLNGDSDFKAERESGNGEEAQRARDRLSRSERPEFADGTRDTVGGSDEERSDRGKIDVGGCACEMMK
jgi:hypothetical protein